MPLRWQRSALTLSSLTLVMVGQHWKENGVWWQCYLEFCKTHSSGPVHSKTASCYQMLRI